MARLSVAGIRLPRTVLRMGSVISAFLLAAAVVGCGSGGDEAATAGGGSEPPSKLTRSTIKIGMVNANTGPVDGASFKVSADVAKAWQAWVNANDGIDGHPVEILIEDSKNEAAQTAKAARKLIDAGVIAQVGGADSANAQVFVKAFTDAKIPVIGGQTPDDAIGKSSPYYFWLAPGLGIVAPLMLDSAKAAGAKRFGAVLCSEATSCAGAAGFWKKRAAQVGIEWGGYVQVGGSDPNYTAACLSLKKTGAEFIEVGVAGAVAKRFIADCARQGIKPPVYEAPLATFDGTILKPAVPAGVTLTGLLGGFPWWIDTPAVKQYREVMEEFGSGVPQNAVATNTWASLEMFRKAMATTTDKPTSAEVYEAMTKVRNEDLDGLLPEPVTFAKGRPSKPFTCLFRAEMRNGEYLGGEPLCLKS